MVRAAERSHAIHQVAFTYRYLYGVQELKCRLLKGDIGEPYHVRVQYASWEGVKRIQNRFSRETRLRGCRNFVRCRISSFDL